MKCKKSLKNIKVMNSIAKRVKIVMKLKLNFEMMW